MFHGQLAGCNSATYLWIGSMRILFPKLVSELDERTSRITVIGWMFKEEISVDSVAVAE